MNDLERIASRDYVVSDNDIVRARLRTVGIQEHRLRFKHGPYDNQKSISSSTQYNLLADIFLKKAAVNLAGSGGYLMLGDVVHLSVFFQLLAITESSLTT